jgi:hypothetical protein
MLQAAQKNLGTLQVFVQALMRAGVVSGHRKTSNTSIAGDLYCSPCGDYRRVYITPIALTGSFEAAHDDKLRVPEGFTDAERDTARVMTPGLFQM